MQPSRAGGTLPTAERLAEAHAQWRVGMMRTMAAAGIGSAMFFVLGFVFHGGMSLLAAAMIGAVLLGVVISLRGLSILSRAGLDPKVVHAERAFIARYAGVGVVNALLLLLVFRGR